MRPAAIRAHRAIACAPFAPIYSQTLRAQVSPALTRDLRLAVVGGPAPATTQAVSTVLARAQVPVQIDDQTAQDAFQPAKKPDIILIFGDPGEACDHSTVPVTQTIRQEYQTYLTLTPIRQFSGLSISRYRDLPLDLLIVRESCSGEATGITRKLDDGSEVGVRLTTERRSEQLAHHAFSLARRGRRKRVTTVHKANIVKRGDGLFLETARRVSTLHQVIEANDFIVDNALMQLAKNPDVFDVVLAPNLYGLMLAQAGVGLLGSASLSFDLSYHPEHPEPPMIVRSMYLTSEQQEAADPTGMLLGLATAMMQVGLKGPAVRIGSAVDAVLDRADLEQLPQSLGGRATLDSYVGHILDELGPDQAAPAT